MKNKINLMLIAVLFMAVGCNSSKNAVQKSAAVDVLVGVWDLTIKDTPQGDIPTKMILTKIDNVYSGKLSNSLGEIPLTNLKISDKKISGDFSTQGIDFNFSGTFKEATFKGSVAGMGSLFLADGFKVVKKQ